MSAFVITRTGKLGGRSKEWWLTAQNRWGLSKCVARTFPSRKTAADHLASLTGAGASSARVEET